MIGVGAVKADSRPKITDLFVDVGATSKEDCPVKVGDVCGFERPFLDLGKRMVAKSMDDRIAAAIAIEAMKRLDSTPNEVHFVFSTQEEVGVRGATTAAYGVDPDVGFAVDVTMSGDTPKLRSEWQRRWAMARRSSSRCFLYCRSPLGGLDGQAG